MKKPNWYALAVFLGVVGAIVCAHLARLDTLTTLLVSSALPLIPALMPAIFDRTSEKKDDAP